MNVVLFFYEKDVKYLKPSFIYYYHYYCYYFLL